MALLTSQRLNELYTKYKDMDVTFTKTVTKALHLISSEIYLKCLGNQWRCVLYSTSMSGSRIILSVDSSIMETIRKANNAASLRFCFMDPDKSTPVSFFIASKVSGFTPYSKTDSNLQFVSLKFNNQPPEDLISIIGLLVEANVNAKKRAEERIVINDENIKILGLKTKSTALSIEGIPRACILRDLSFAGAKLIISGIGKFLVNKQASIKLEMEDIPALSMQGKVLRYDSVETRKDLSTLGIQFNEDSIPIEYKMRINDYFARKKKPSV